MKNFGKRDKCNITKITYIITTFYFIFFLISFSIAFEVEKYIVFWEQIEDVFYSCNEKFGENMISLVYNPPTKEKKTYYRFFSSKEKVEKFVKEMSVQKTETKLDRLSNLPISAKVTGKKFKKYKLEIIE